MTESPEASTGPIYETVLFASLLTMTAGALDAYSYLLHNEVFAGLQTGNLILLGLHLGRGDLDGAGQYALSIGAFIFGTILVRFFQHQIKRAGRSDTFRKRWVMVYQLVVIAIALAMYPFKLGHLPTAVMALAAAAELQEFRRLHGGPFTPLMMTGNVRKVSEAGLDWLRYHDPQARRVAAETITIILSFAGGGFITGLMVRVIGPWALVVPMITIVLALGVDIYKQKQGELAEHAS
ncbi:YoaK family protein [Leuconostocaceae bacterium ESL0723]|nr:YoaK family protein [Leuconostocaceae bacterium ESL0723]